MFAKLVFVCIFENVKQLSITQNYKTMYKVIETETGKVVDHNTTEAEAYKLIDELMQANKDGYINPSNQECYQVVELTKLDKLLAGQEFKYRDHPFRQQIKTSMYTDGYYIIENGIFKANIKSYNDTEMEVYTMFYDKAVYATIPLTDIELCEN